jgi:Mg-chelatase subunit ChlD
MRWLAWIGIALALAAPPTWSQDGGEQTLTATVHGIAGSLGESRAPVGWEFISLDVKLVNRDPAAFGAGALARRLTLYEDGEFPYFADQRGEAVDGTLWREQEIAPGQSLAGRLVFAVPRNRGSLSLVLDGVSVALAAPGPVSLDRAVEAGNLRLEIESYDLRQSYLGEAPPAGSLFVVVVGRLVNLSSVSGLRLPEAVDGFVLHHPGGYGALSPLSADSPSPLWGEVVLESGEARPFDAVFVLPEGVIDRASLAMAGTNMGTVTVVLGSGAAAPAIAGPLSLGGIEMAVLGSRRLDDALAVSVAFANLDPLSPLRLRLDEEIVLVENGDYVHLQNARSSPHFAMPLRFLAGLPMAGDLLFPLPEAGASLALVYATPDGLLTLPFEGDASASSEPLAREGNGDLEVALFGFARSAGLLSVDLALTLLGADPRQVAVLRPADQIVLAGDDGRAYAVVEAGLPRELSGGTLWQSLRRRGSLSFAVPATVAPESLVLQVGIIAPVIELPLAAAATEAPAPAPQPVPRADGVVLVTGGPEAQQQFVHDAARGIELSLARGAFEPGWPVLLAYSVAEAADGAWFGLMDAEAPHGDSSVADQHDLDYEYLGGHLQGIREFPAPTTPGRYELRLLANNTDGSELAAIAFSVVAPVERSAPVAADITHDEPLNIAPYPFGNQASGGYSGSGIRMIDNDTTVAGGAYGPMGEEAPITVTFARSYSIEHVRITYPQRNNGFYKYRLEGTRDGGGTWELVAERSERPYRGVQEIALSGQVLGGLRIVPVEHTLGSHFTVLELEAYTRDPAPLTGVAGAVNIQHLSRRSDVAAAINGGRIVETSSQGPGRRTAQRLIESVPGGATWYPGVPVGPQHVVVAFRDDRATTIDSVAFRADPGSYGRHAPRRAAIAVRMPAGEWVEIGRYGAFEGGHWQKISFAPVLADRVRLTFEGSYLPPYSFALAEIAVFERVEDSAQSILPFGGETAALGYNIARDALGGTVVSASNVESDFAALTLIDGGVYDWGWYSTDAAMPMEFVLSFHRNRTAMIGGVAFHPYAHFNTFRPITVVARRIEVLVSETSATSDFTSIGVFNVDLDFSRQVFSFPPVAARFVKLRVLANHGGGQVALGEIEVLEAVQPGSETILVDRDIDLLDLRFGGHVVMQKGWFREGLIDGGTETGIWGLDVPPPIDLVFGFYRHRAPRIDRVVINPGAEGRSSEGWVKRFKLYLSDDSLVDGWRLVGEYELAPELRDQVFRFPETTARYVKLSLLENHGGSGYGFELGEVSMPEVRRPGLGTILTGAPGDQEALGTIEVGGGRLAERAEIEPNAALSHATALPLAMPIEGHIDPADDVDIYRIDTTGAELPGLNVTVEESPVLNVDLELLDESGELIDEQPLYDLGRGEARLTWQVPQGVYHLRVSRPLSAIVVLSDLSGSTDSVRGDITKSLLAFAEQSTPYEYVSMVGFCSSLVVAAEMSQDKDVLREAAWQLFGGCNGTGLYRAMDQGLDWLNERRGLRAILIVTDGEDSSNNSGNLEKVWAKLLDSDVRVYAIGYGGALDGRLDGMNGRQLLRSWSDASGGAYYEAPSGAAINTVTAQIGNALRKVSHYRLVASVPKGEGGLSVSEVGESVGGVAAPSQIALILDASGSMRGRDSQGERKMGVAKQTMRALIGQLPEQTRVGLRVYGHRLPQEPKARSCTDSELVVPFGPLDRDRLLGAIDAIAPKGHTPIGRSLAALSEDFAGSEGRKVVILVTDGKETCNAEPDDPLYPPTVVQSLLDSGLEIKVDVIGFDIGESETREFLRQIADAGDGLYFDASDADGLAEALEEAVRAEFEVADSAGSLVAEGRVGEPALLLPEGLYQVALAVAPPLEIVDVAVLPDQETRLTLDKEGTRIGVAREVVALAAPETVVAVVPPTEPDAATEAQVAALLREGAALFAAQKLTTPEGEAAVDRFRAVLALQPGNHHALAGLRRIADTYAGWAETNLARGNATKAAGYLARAVSVDSQRADLHARHGDALFAAGQLDEAEAAYRQALALEPGFPPAVNGLAAIVVPIAEPVTEPEPLSVALEGVAEVLDTGTLVIAEQVVRLLGVDGVDGAPAVGLRGYIGSRAVSCLPVGERYRCQLGDFDLSHVVLYNGGGRASADAPAALREAEARARDAKVGIWH